MTAPDDNGLTWVDLYHPGLGSEFRSTTEAYQEIHRHKGWVARDEAAVPLLTTILAGRSDEVSDAGLRVALHALYPDADFTQTPRDLMVSRVEVLPHHVDADTPIGRRLAELVEAGPTEWPQSPSPDVGEYDPDGHTVAEVNSYLDGQLAAGNTGEVDRVLGLEEDGQNRKGIVVDGPAAKQRKDQ